MEMVTAYAPTASPEVQCAYERHVEGVYLVRIRVIPIPVIQLLKEFPAALLNTGAMDLLPP